MSAVYVGELRVEPREGDSEPEFKLRAELFRIDGPKDVFFRFELFDKKDRNHWLEGPAKQFSTGIYASKVLFLDYTTAKGRYEAWVKFSTITPREKDCHVVGEFNQPDHDPWLFSGTLKRLAIVRQETAPRSTP